MTTTKMVHLAMKKIKKVKFCEIGEFEGNRINVSHASLVPLSPNRMVRLDQTRKILHKPLGNEF